MHWIAPNNKYSVSFLPLWFSLSIQDRDEWVSTYDLYFSLCFLDYFFGILPLLES